MARKAAPDDLLPPTWDDIEAMRAKLNGARLRTASLLQQQAAWAKRLRIASARLPDRPAAGRVQLLAAEIAKKVAKDARTPTAPAYNDKSIKTGRTLCKTTNRDDSTSRSAPDSAT